MSLKNAEFKSILDDNSKRIEDDIKWEEDEDRSSAWEFQADVYSDGEWSMFVCGSYNPPAKTLTYALILKTEGRIYGLDLGKDHRNPSGKQVGEKHKHRWTEEFRDKEAYVPEDISAPVSDPVAVWNQFCKEARISHNGKLLPPPSVQKGLFS